MPAIPVTVLCLLAVLIIFCLLLYKIVQRGKDKDHNPLKKLVKVTVIVVFVCNMFGIVSLLAMTILMVTAEQWDETTWNQSRAAIYCVSAGYILGKAALETFFISRVRDAFQESVLALSKCTYYCLFFVLSVITLMWLLLLIVVDYTNSDFLNADYNYLVLGVADAVFVTALLVLFVKKLNALVIMQKTELSLEMSSRQFSSRQLSSQTAVSADETNAEADTTDVKMHHMMTVPRAITVDDVQQTINARQTKLIYVITRCIVLNSTAFVTTVLFGFLAFYYVQDGTNVYFLYSGWSLDMLVNSICLFLNFAFAGDMYSKCCGCCHKRCQNLMEYCTAKQILHEHVVSIEKQMSQETSNASLPTKQFPE